MTTTVDTRWKVLNVIDSAPDQEGDIHVTVSMQELNSGEICTVSMTQRGLADVSYGVAALEVARLYFHYRFGLEANESAAANVH